jgi:transmembrane sensor
MPGRQPTRREKRRHQEAVDWLLRNRADGAGREAPGFREWLTRDPENQASYAAAERLLGETRAAILSDPALMNFDVAPRRRVAGPLIALLLLAGMAGGAFVLGDGPMRLRADAISGSNEMPTVTLADGSIMQLNASSAVAFAFTDTARTVKLLRGQAYFQVKADAARPFVVEAAGGWTRALGTAFDIRSANDETEVTVTEHAVVTGVIGARQAPTRLQEGEQARYRRDGTVIDVRPVRGEDATAWRRGLLVVDNAKLSDVVAEVERHFSGRIIIAGASASERRLSGTLAVNDTDAAIAFLEQGLGVKAVRIGWLIIIRG